MNDLTKTENQLPLRDDFAETKAQISKDLGSDLIIEEIAEAANFVELKTALLALMREMLKSGKPRLMQLIYRVDISEAHLGRELEHLNPEEAAHRLADLIIERERQKVETRRRWG